MKTFAKILSLTLVAVMLCGVLASCAPASKPDDAADALKDADYAVDTTVGTLALKALGVKDLEKCVSATKNTDHVTILYFKSASAAKDAMETVEKQAKDDKKDDSNWVFKRSGKMIYWGTKDAVKAAR